MAWVAVAIGGSALIGAGVGYISNKNAAETAKSGAIEGANIQAASNAEARAQMERLSREGMAENVKYGTEAVGRLDTLAGTNREEALPARHYLRNVIATPGSLTPEQAAQLAELRRTTGNQIRTSSIAGSGRTAASLLRKVESDFTNSALTANKQRADAAASTMYGTGTNAANSAQTNAAQTTADIGRGNANTLIGVGTNASNLISKSGEAQGNAVAKGGLYDAQAGLATGKVAGEAIGDVGWAIADMAKKSKFGGATAA